MQLKCAYCAKHSCAEHDLEHAPSICPSLPQQGIDLGEVYRDGEMKMAHEAALVESEGYCKNTRVEELMDFAYKMGYHKIGLAFCAGLSNEAKTFCKILEANGFETCSIICKNGSFGKTCIGIKPEQFVHGGDFEVMCNPAMQAELLNQENTELNIILGLCVGHDTLFIKHSKAPVTVLAVKDRVTGHNPLSPIYTYESYYKKLGNFIERKYGKK